MKVTLFKGINPRGEQKEIDFDQLCEKVLHPKEYPNKAAQLGLSLATYKGNYRKSDNLELYSGLEIDVDCVNGFMPFESGVKLLDKENIRGVYFTTASNTPTSPSWRGIFPFSEPRTHEEMVGYAEQVNFALDGVLGIDSVDKARFYYIGKVVGSDYGCAVTSGDFIDDSDWFAMCPKKPIYGKKTTIDDNDDFLEKAVDIEKSKHPIDKESYPALYSALLYLAAKGHADSYNSAMPIAFGLKNSGQVGQVFFDAFCSESKLYDPAWSLRVWESIRVGAETGFKAIFAKAQALGWRQAKDYGDSVEFDLLSMFDDYTPAIKNIYPETLPSFNLTSAANLSSTPAPKTWLIKKIIEPRKLHTLIGESGAGKSFLALDMAWHIAHGESWNGHSVKQSGDVVYIAGEGRAGVEDRLRALGKHHNKPLPSNFFISNTGIMFDKLEEVDLLVNTIKQHTETPALVIIDTLHRNFSSDENSSKDIALFINNIGNRLINDGLNCAVLVVHHSGHGDKDRGRGSSAIRAAVDVELLMKKDIDGEITLSCSKAKDFSPGEPLAFKLQSVVLDYLDDEGDEVTSAVIVCGGNKSVEVKLKPDQQEALDCLGSLLMTEGEPNQALTDQLNLFKPDMFDENTEPVLAILDSDWAGYLRDEIKKKEPDIKKQALSNRIIRIKNRLISSGRVVILNGFVTIKDG